MATHYSKDLSAPVEDDSGYHYPPSPEAEHTQTIPQNGDASTNRPVKVSEGVLAFNEREGIPTLETAQESAPPDTPDLQNGTGSVSAAAADLIIHGQSLDVQEGAGPQPVFFVGGDVVSPEEERSYSGSVGAMVGIDREDSRQELKGKLTERDFAICELREELKSTTLDKERAQQKYIEAKEQYKNVIASKDAEINRLKTEVENYKSRISILEKINRQNVKQKYVSFKKS